MHVAEEKRTESSPEESLSNFCFKVLYATDPQCQSPEYYQTQNCGDVTIYSPILTMH